MAQSCIDDAVAGDADFGIVQLHLQTCRSCAQYLLTQLDLDRELKRDAGGPHALSNLPASVWETVSRASASTKPYILLRWTIGLIGVFSLLLVGVLGVQTRGQDLGARLVLSGAGEFMSVLGVFGVILAVWPEWTHRLKVPLAVAVAGVGLTTLTGNRLDALPGGAWIELADLALGIVGVGLLFGSEWMRRPRMHPLEMRFIAAHWRESRPRRIALVVTMALVISVPFLVLSSLDQGSRVNVGGTASITELAMRHTGVVCMKTPQSQGFSASKRGSL